MRASTDLRISHCIAAARAPVTDIFGIEAIELKMRAAAAVLWLVVAALGVATAVVDGTRACPGSPLGLAALQSDANVTVRRTKGVGYAFRISPATPVPLAVGGPRITRGIVILPEDHVAPEAYAPLARALALLGSYTTIVEATTVHCTIKAMMERPELKYWILAGHGQGGGGLASSLALTLYPKEKGLILFASAMPEDVDMAIMNMMVVALYSRGDTIVTPTTIEGSFVRFPGDADVTLYDGLGHYDFAYNMCVGNALHAGPTTMTYADFCNIVAKILNTIEVAYWSEVGTKALSFADNKELMLGKNISKPYPGDIRVHSTKIPIPSSNPKRWWWVFTPTVIKGGLVYYPGAGVDARAYFPLAFEIAARGQLVVILQMPLRFASFHFKEANIVIDSLYFHQVPSNKWTVGGHSLGGIATSLYAASFGKRIYAAVLHSGWWWANLTQNPLPMVNIYGTLDNLTPGGYDRFRYLNTNPPPRGSGPLVNLKTTKFVAIEGANHFQVGDYGYQYPDDIAIISMEKQWKIFAKETIVFLEGVANLK